MNEKHLRATILFYFLSFLDESAAQKATIKTVNRCQRKLNKLSIPENESVPDSVVVPMIVHETHRLWLKWYSSHRNQLVGETSTFEGGWLLADQVQLGSWKEFRKESNVDEYLALIWSQVLGFSEDYISQGLGVTVGTIRHRVGRGLRVLGRQVA